MNDTLNIGTASISADDVRTSPQRLQTTEALAYGRAGLDRQSGRITWSWTDKDGTRHLVNFEDVPSVLQDAVAFTAEVNARHLS